MKQFIEPITVAAITNKARREIKMRERVYPRWIETGRMSRHEADWQILKMRGEKPSAEQLKKHDELRASGAVVIVADEFYRFVSDFEAVRAQIVCAQSNQIKLYE